jgi:hypothetical protein
MVAVKMTDEDVTDPVMPYLESGQLRLCAFTAINQKKPLTYIQYLSGWMSIKSGCCGTASENG